MFINKLTVDREYAGQDLGGRLIDGLATARTAQVHDGFDWTRGRRTRGFSGTTLSTDSPSCARFAREPRGERRTPGLGMARSADGTTGGPRIHRPDACTNAAPGCCVS